MKTLLLMLMAFVMPVVLTGCPTNPIKEAKDPELKAQALYGEFVIQEKRMVDVLNNPEVPDSVKLGLKQAHDTINPIVEKIEANRVAIGDLRVTKPEDVPGALRALDELITQAQPLVNDFRTSLEKEKTP